MNAGYPRPAAGACVASPAGGACTAGVGEILAQLTIEVNSQAKYLGNKKPAGAWPGEVDLDRLLTHALSPAKLSGMKPSSKISPRRAVEAAIRMLGGAYELASALGVTGPLVYQWLSGHRRVSAERAIQIEALTAGLVRCEDLRPDVDWSVLRCPEKVSLSSL